MFNYCTAFQKILKRKCTISATSQPKATIIPEYKNSNLRRLLFFKNE